MSIRENENNINKTEGKELTNPRDVTVRDKMLDDINAELNKAYQEPSGVDDRIGKAKEKLVERQVTVGKAVRRTLHITYLIISLLSMLAVCGIIAGGVWAYNQGNFYSSRAIDERGCGMTVGKDWVVLGRRYYTYRYRDILGYRLIDTKGIEERTEMFMDASDMIITGVTKEGTFWYEKWPKGEPGVFPMPDAERYIVFSGEVVGTTTYHDFCKQFNKKHPFATE